MKLSSSPRISTLEARMSLKLRDSGNQPRKSSLSPRYQISLRSMLNIKHQVDDDERFKTYKQIDDYFTRCSTNPDDSHLVYLKKTKARAAKESESPFSMYFTKPEIKYEALNKVVAQFNQHLIQTLYQALVAHHVHYVYRIDKVGTITNILSSFGVQASYLSELSDEGKRAYIIQKFNQTIDQQLASWKAKIERKYQPDDAQSSDPNLFYWMKLKTKYQALKASLQKLLYQKLSLLDNLEAELKTHKVLHFDNVQRITLAELIQKIDPHVGQLLMSLKGGPQAAKTHNLVKKASGQPGKNEQPDFLWSDELELNFLKHRHAVRVASTRKINSSNFNRMGFAPLTQAINKKYDDLSKEELKFIKTTSTLLAKCVDKKLYQEALDRINPDQLSVMESNIAESIIEGHECLMKIVKNARLIYLQQKSRELKEQISLREKRMKIARSVEKYRASQNSHFRAHLIRKLRYNYFVYYFAKIVMKRIVEIRQRWKIKANRGRSPIIITSRMKSPRSVSVREKSTGPIKYERNGTMRRLRAVVKIQALIRRFIARCRFRKYITAKLRRFLEIFLKRKQHI